MADPFIGEIRLVGFNFAPQGWALCNGQLLQINQYQALFALLSTTYGGDGRTTFGIPDLRGRVPVGVGQGPGLTNITLGQKSGNEAITLNVSNMPAHNHAATFSGTPSQVATSITVGTSSASSIANPTAGSTVYLSAAAAEYGGDPVDLKGLYSSSAPASGASGQIAGGNVSLTPQGSVVVSNNGASQPFDNRPPFIGLNYIIALTGFYPTRN